MEIVLSKEIITDKMICRIIGVCSLIILTAFGAFIRIPLPFTPVPITLQTFFVLLAAAFMGGRLGAITQVGYLLLGVAGLPVFSGAASGLTALLGPTGGYLFGFILAALFLGKYIKYSRNNLFSTIMIFSFSDFILLSCGVIWLKFFFRYSLNTALLLGFVPFIPGDLLKIIAASFLYLKMKPRLKEIF